METRIRDLFTRYVNNDLSEAETAELMLLMSHDAHNDLFKQLITEQAGKAVSENDRMDAHQASEVLKNILAYKEEKKVVSLYHNRAIRWSAAAIFVFAALGLFWYAGGDHSPFVTRNSSLTDEPATGNRQPVTASNFRNKQFISLPDGSTVILNDNSTLSYNADFNGALREVKLEGEAFFDIKHDPTKPFRVHTGKIITTVLGTAFNIKTGPALSEVEVTVTRGKVQVGDDTKIFGLLTPDQQLSVNTKTMEFKQISTKADAATQWRDSFIILDRISMEAATAILEARYHVKFTFDTPEAKDCIITASFLHDESLEQVLTVISTVLQIDYSVLADGNIRLEGSCQ